MSGQFPTTPNFRALDFRDNRPTLLNQTLSGKRSVRQIGSQYFSFTVQMPPMEQLEAQAIFAFLQKQKGSFENFTIQAPLNNKGVSYSETDILVNAVHAAGVSAIAMDGFSQTTNALRAGDIIKFANHSKVYMVQSDVTASGGGATVNISPNLVTALADNEAVTVNKPLFTVYLANDEIMYSTDASGLYTISFDVREVIT
jgi:hypothetical protein|tara:strand:- start:756 stop:1355 length:600 start_codon:yes stop_codon:yes gene_type:complete